jgi:hypothetical protein
MGTDVQMGYASCCNVISLEEKEVIKTLIMAVNYI